MSDRKAWEWQENMHRSRARRASRNGRIELHEKRNYIQPQLRSRAKSGHRYLDNWLSPPKR